MKALGDDVYTLDEVAAVPGEGDSCFIFGRGWLLEILYVEAGEYHFISGDEKVKPAGPHFGVFYPSFTIVRPYVKDVRVCVRGIGSIRAFPELPRSPFVFETDFSGQFTRIEQAFEVLGSSGKRLSIEINPAPSFLSIKAKRLIDREHTDSPSISRIAKKLRVSPEHLSRQFKRDFGLSPSEYLHKLRVAEATFRLTLDEAIVDVSMEVGYNDLSRFYKQFRKATRTSPGMCRSQLK